ncbi:MAG: glycosidase-like protein [Promethearchaeota archaeon CR_4]|nr:MAG: glycosidase-like protein [Candidatus Lokiarchaeota archaeon CR_4]
MVKIKISGDPQPNIPWEERPNECQDVIWRYSKNPIIHRNQFPTSNSIFNSAVVPFKGKFAGVFRCDDTARRMNIHFGRSEDGLHWEIEPEPIQFSIDSPAILESEYKYDPRITWLEDRYYVTWCNGYHGPTIGAGYTYDFKQFYQIENIFMPYNRNGVLFPRKIKGKFAILSRPSDRGHTPFGDMFYSESPDMTYWGCHRFVMGTRGADSSWQSTKVGPGPIPIETSEGWLLFYHGVLTSCNGFVYSMGAALLDLDEPWNVMKRTRPYLLSPQTPYECVGDVPNVVFPCATLQDPKTGRITIYYGCADTVVGLAFTYVDELLEFIEKNSL